MTILYALFVLLIAITDLYMTLLYRYSLNMYITVVLHMYYRCMNYMCNTPKNTTHV